MSADPAPPDPRPVGKEEVSDALIAATLRLLVERGPTVSIRDIASEAQVNHALIYRHFGSKEALISASLDDLTGRLGARLQAGTEPLDALLSVHNDAVRVAGWIVLHGATALFRSHPATLALVDRARRSSENSEYPPEVRAAAAATIGMGWRLFADFTWQAAGLDPDRIDDNLMRRLVDDVLAGRMPTQSTAEAGPDVEE